MIKSTDDPSRGHCDLKGKLYPAIMRIPVGCRLLCTLLALLVALSATAQESAGRPRSGTTFTASATAFHQPKTDIDGGGNFTLSSAFLRFKVSYPFTPTTAVGLSLKYDIDDYDFSGSTSLGGKDPWNDVRRFGVGIPIFMRLGQRWALGLTPTINWLQEYGADSNDSISYGISGFAFRSFTRDKRLGLGAVFSRTVEDENKVFPILAVDWRFNEHWRLANPFDADVVGPAGLELGYSFNDHWSLRAGGVYRSFRFRLDNEGVAPNGIGENEGIVTFLRLNRSGKGGLKLDIYAGAMLDGKLKLKNAEGSKLISRDYDTAPFIALAFSADF
jgi:hypothetical protein